MQYSRTKKTRESIATSNVSNPQHSHDNYSDWFFHDWSFSFLMRHLSENNVSMIRASCLSYAPLPLWWNTCFVWYADTCGGRDIYLRLACRPANDWINNNIEYLVASVIKVSEISEPCLDYRHHHHHHPHRRNAKRQFWDILTIKFCKNISKHIR